MADAHAHTKADIKQSAAGGQSFRLKVTGLSCANCARTAQRTLSGVEGVERASVNFALERADVRALDARVTFDVLQSALQGAGFDAELPGAQTLEDGGALQSKEQVHLLVAIFLTLPLVLPMLAGGRFMAPPLVQLLLAAPVQFWIGFRFYRGAWMSLKAGSSNMDVLVALGTTAAFVYSVWQMFRVMPGQMPHLYFEASAVIIALVLTGKWLETRAKRGASDAIRMLLSLRPETARVKRDGAFVEISADAVIAGDILLVRPGERVPVDASVLEGRSEVDASHITGESLPVLVEAGAELYGGSLNGSGAVTLIATAGADTSTLAKIIELVERAQGTRAPIERLVDKVSAIFVPVVVVISILTFMTWYALGGGFEQALIASVAVLVIACPCALGLATPTALVAGLGAAARGGILIKDIDALERAAHLTHIAFDKTGTLTAGTPQVVGLASYEGADDDLLALAASVQVRSEHLLGKAIRQEAEARGLELAQTSDFENFIGEGVSGLVNGKRIVIGNAALLERFGIEANRLREGAPDAAARGATQVFVARDQNLLGDILIADPVRPGARQAVAKLKSNGHKIYLLSGDTQATAQAIGAPLGIGDIRGQLKPQDKLEVLSKLHEEDAVIAMVGDGINDAPALAAADVGIAMGGGTDVAIETASIALMRPDPMLVPAAIDISLQTRRKIRQNLGWAFVYNTIGIPLAALGFLSPAFAAGAMALSSLSVVSNSLLLRKWKPEQGEPS